MNPKGTINTSNFAYPDLSGTNPLLSFFNEHLIVGKVLFSSITQGKPPKVMVIFLSEIFRFGSLSSVTSRFGELKV